MVDFDPVNGNTPNLTNRNHTIGLPTVVALKAAISGSGVAARYPASFLNSATKNDLIYVCRTHSIAVAGL